MLDSSAILRAKCLIVDDNAVNVSLLEQMLRDAGYSSISSTMDPRAVVALHQEHGYDLILLDLQMPGMDGFEVMERLGAAEPDGYIPVLVVTAQPAHKQRALAAGAKDFVSKPFDVAEVLMRVHNLLEVRLLYRQVAQDKRVLERAVEQRTSELVTANEALRLLKDRFEAESIHFQQDIDRGFNFGEVIGQSEALEQVFRKVMRVASQHTTVLLLGETGTGKGVVARAIHNQSARCDRPLITVDCTALPASLIESELFGREKGAFTGSDARQMGRFELADRGTIFLDEIGELPLELQGKLLRVIQDGEFERLGNPRTIKVDVRIIAATNRDLQEEIRQGRFRKDLFYRLNVFPIVIPPLRERSADIALLVNFFVAKFNKKIGRSFATVATETLRALEEYTWPGNVRELESVIERAVISGTGTALRVTDRLESPQRVDESSAHELDALADREREHIIRVLQKTGWRIEGASGAACIVGLHPSTLRGRMRKYGIRR